MVLNSVEPITSFKSLERNVVLNADVSALHTLITKAV